MNYLISMFECCLLCDGRKHLQPYVPYICEFKELIYANNSIIFITDFDQLPKIKLGNDCYYFLFSKEVLQTKVFNIVHKTENYTVCLNSNLIINNNGAEILNMQVGNIKYSHSVEVGSAIILFFTGVRNFLVVLKEGAVKVSTYYDELNRENEEIIISFRFDYYFINL